ncbi:hypothetical protein OIU79_030649 [Salix purpurea]|uniref:Uncharacterized protein n=1 Tax=Salix purpurea TaxID=77065 RepID=A0A9Q0V917_SALPP|nr:hypothetical protein OIU79_030649 [Salix purpurea]
MEGVPPSSMDDAVNQLELETFNMSELSWSLPEEVPVNQSSMLCNDQAGQHMLVDDNVINDTIQQTTWFPPSFPQTMMEGAPPFFVDDNVSLTSNQLDTLMSELPPSFSQTMITMGGLDGASSSWINQNGPNWPQTPSSDQQWTDQLPMSNQVPGMLPQPPMNQCSGQFPYQALITPNLYGPQCSAMLPEPSQTLRSPQFPPHNLQVSGDHNQGQVDQASVIPHIENMQQESLMPLNFDRSTRLQNSFIHQPQLGHVYMTPNATTSQHGGFNQPAPRIQCIPNQGQVDQADMIPNIDNMQQENFVPRNLGRSTRSQMENLQVRGLQNQTARPNASNPGPDSSLQSQNTQQVRSLTELSSSFYAL